MTAPHTGPTVRLQRTDVVNNKWKIRLFRENNMSNKNEVVANPAGLVELTDAELLGVVGAGGSKRAPIRALTRTTRRVPTRVAAATARGAAASRPLNGRLCRP